MTRIDRAAKKIEDFRRKISDACPPLSILLKEDLDEQLSKVTYATTDYHRELALLHLERGDALRSVVLALEGANERHGGRYPDELYPRSLPHDLKPSYDDLRVTRNAIVHVDTPDAASDRKRKVERWLAEPEKLQRELAPIIKALLR